MRHPAENARVVNTACSPPTPGPWATGGPRGLALGGSGVIRVVHGPLLNLGDPGSGFSE